MNLGDVLKSAPEKRDQIRELTTLNAAWNLKLLVLLGMWVVAGWAIVSTDSLAVRVPAWLVIGMVIHSFAIFLHESVHGVLFKNAFLNRWVGFLCGVPALITVAKTRREMIVEYTLIYTVFAGVIYAAYSAGRMDLFIDLWLIPAAVALVLVNLRGASEHIMCVASDDFTDSRTVTSNYGDLLRDEQPQLPSRAPPRAADALVQPQALPRDDAGRVRAREEPYPQELRLLPCRADHQGSAR